MLLPIILGQVTWHYQFYLLHIWGSQEKKRVLEWYLSKKDIELPPRCVSKFCAICVTTQCRNLDMK